MQNYTGYGWEGKNYNSNLGTRDIAKIVKQQLKESFPECKFSVVSQYYAGGSALHVSLMAAPFQAFIDTTNTHEQVNYFYIDKDERLTENAKRVLAHTKELVQSFNYNDSDGMIDYFNTNFYLHLNVGKWDKPFQCVARL